jgi:hypothetical protein
VTIEQRIARLEARIEEIAGAVSQAWARIERGRVAPPAPTRPAPAQARAEDVQVPAAQAARALGCDVRTVRRLIASGKLAGKAAPLSGDRRHWSASASDLDRLLAEKAGSTAACAASDAEKSSPTRASVRG